MLYVICSQFVVQYILQADTKVDGMKLYIAHAPFIPITISTLVPACTFPFTIVLNYQNYNSLVVCEGLASKDILSSNLALSPGTII